MFHSKKTSVKVAKSKSVDPGYPVSSGTNPFDSDDELNNKQTIKPLRRKSSAPVPNVSDVSTNPFDDEVRNESSHSTYSLMSGKQNNYKNDFRDSGGLQNQSVEELENYAVYKSKDTTKTVNNCLKIAEDIREGATSTLVMLHQQGEQITRTHQNAADIDHDLTRGEKLLGSLGGIFSKTWKPKKTRSIMGPVSTRDDLTKNTAGHFEQKEKLGLNHAPKKRSGSRTTNPEPTNALETVEAEKAKQDDAFSDLSNLLGELKNMAVDMGTEMDRQKPGLDRFNDDVEVLNDRVRGANQRTRRLLGK